MLDIKKSNLSFMYPLLIENGGELRKYLGLNNIYSLLLWPNLKWNGANLEVVNKSKNMVLLPIEQRYSEYEMKYVVDTIVYNSQIN